MTVRPAALGVILVLGIHACGPGDDDGAGTPPGVTGRDSAGVTIRESAEPVLGTGAWSLSGEPLLTIGGIEAAPAYLLNRIGDVVVTPEGGLVVANRGVPDVRVYGPDGSHRATLGRRGEGPGEFLGIAGLVLRGDTVEAFDGRQRRVTRYTLGGELLGTVQLEEISGGEVFRSLSLFKLLGRLDGAHLLVPAAFPANMQPRPQRYRDTIPTLRFTLDGALRDTVGEFMGMDAYGTPQRAGAPTFGRFSSAALGEGRLYQTDGGRVDVRVYGPDGELREVLRAAVQPAPVTNELREAYFDQAYATADPERLPEYRSRYEEWPVRDSVPLVSDLVAADDGSLWVEEWAWYDIGLPRRWWVFDGEGRWVTTLERPEGVRLRAVVGDRLVGVHTDPGTGVESVRVYGLVRDQP